MICPICSGPMKNGEIRADGVRMDFITKHHNRIWRMIRLDPEADEFCLASEWAGAATVSAAYCKKCGKLIIDVGRWE